MTQSNLPQIQELYDDVKLREKENDLNVLLNQPPKKEWIKQHPVQKNVQYLSIGRVEYLLTRIFQKWYVEVRETQLLGNSIVVTVRIWYKDPLNGEWLCTDGVGAQPLQTAKGAGAIDFNNLNSNAVQLAAPAAKSYAIKDAVEHLGKLFGRDINRKDQVGYDNLAGRFRSHKDQLRQQITDKLDKLEQAGYKVSSYRDELQQAQADGKLTEDYLNELLVRLNDVEPKSQES
ncbi:MAG: hypothetical protein K9J21_07165 [Bacteroidales bacterium]|nr:hypothetical protein [Bacteroidales bacterium]